MPADSQSLPDHSTCPRCAVRPIIPSWIVKHERMLEDARADAAAEVARLRAALEEVANYEVTVDEHGHMDAQAMQRIARETLNGDTDDRG